MNPSKRRADDQGYSERDEKRNSERAAIRATMPTMQQGYWKRPYGMPQERCYTGNYKRVAMGANVRDSCKCHYNRVANNISTEVHVCEEFCSGSWLMLQESRI